MSERDDPSSFSELLESVLSEFASALAEGRTPDPDEFCRSHPECGPELRERVQVLVSARRLLSVTGGECIALEKGTHGFSLAPGGSFGPYRIVRQIGEGGMGMVYLAEHLRLSRRVALKVLRPSLALSPPYRLRLQREAEIASKIEHPNLCAVYDAGEEEGVPYIAMRYIEGETLAQRIRRARGEGDPPSERRTPQSPRVPPLSGGTSDSARLALASPSTAGEVEDLVRLIERAARALHVGHEAGLVHRDIKPGNLMVTKEGEPVILDFGLAREETSLTLTQSGDLLGTPPYMSPEQLEPVSGPPDRRTDVYSLGVTLYECLTLRLPFEAPTREGLYRKILSSEPPSPRRFNPHVPRELEAVLEAALEKNIDRRYRTALHFAEDLRRFREREPILVRRAGPFLRLRRWIEREPRLAASLGAILLLLAVGLAVSLVQQRRLGRESGEKASTLRHLRALGLAQASTEALGTEPMLALLLRAGPKTPPGFGPGLPLGQPGAGAVQRRASSAYSSVNTPHRRSLPRGTSLGLGPTAGF